MTRCAARVGKAILLRVVLVAALGALASCGDSPEGPKSSDTTTATDPTGVIVSSPAPISTVVAAQRASFTPPSRTVTASPELDEVSYVSLPPGSAPEGSIALIDRVGGDSPIWTSVRDAGFDPVPIAVLATDTVEVRITSASGAVVYRASVAIRPTRPPAIVRSYPPGKKTDVAINSSVVIVFSEPMDTGAVSTSSMRLFRGSTSISGTVRLLPGSGTTAAFTPSAPLAVNTDYQFVVSRAARNAQGQLLPNDVTTSFRTGTGSTGPVASVHVSPDSVHLANDTYQMTALVQDASGNVLVDVPVTWSTSDPNGVSVSSTGLLMAQSEGTFEVRAEAGGLTGSATIFVQLPDLPASIVLSPPSAELPVGAAIGFQAIVKDALGRVLQRPVSWSSSNESAVVIDPDYYGRVKAIAVGTATVTARSGGAVASVMITVVPLQIPPVTFGSLVAPGAAHTCALDSTGAARCWGDAWVLGDGTSYDRSIPGRVAGGSAYSELVSAPDYSCGLSAAGQTYCWGFGADRASTLDGASLFTQIAVAGINLGLDGPFGYDHGCGLVASGSAYCWGDNSAGQIGDGTSNDQAMPVPVVGSQQFQTIAVGGWRSCALTNAGAVYCWGGRVFGATPTPLAGGLTFKSLSVAGAHGCGLTTSGIAYCWGDNDFGELGDGTFFQRDGPVAVVGGHVFSTLSTGSTVTCGIDTGGKAYCWGYNTHGQLGDGTTVSHSTSPVPVAGNIAFQSIAAGDDHVCGFSTSGILYCWGWNHFGQLGDGTMTDRNVPARVVGQP